MDLSIIENDSTSFIHYSLSAIGKDGSTILLDEELSAAQEVGNLPASASKATAEAIIMGNTIFEFDKFILTNKTTGDTISFKGKDIKDVATIDEFKEDIYSDRLSNATSGPKDVQGLKYEVTGFEKTLRDNGEYSTSVLVKVTNSTEENLTEKTSRRISATTSTKKAIDAKVFSEAGQTQDIALTFPQGVVLEEGSDVYIYISQKHLSADTFKIMDKIIMKATVKY